MVQEPTFEDGRKLCQDGSEMATAPTERSSLAVQQGLLESRECAQLCLLMLSYRCNDMPTYVRLCPTGTPSHGQLNASVTRGLPD